MTSLMSEPRIVVEFTRRFKKDLNRLSKKYKHVRSDVQPVIDRLVNGEKLGVQIQLLDYAVYKVRVRSIDQQRGKSGGYRLIYYAVQAEKLLLLTIYAKNEASDLPASTIRAMIEDHESD